MVAAGYGMGAIATTFPISASIADAGYQATLQKYGIVFAIIGIAAALGLRPPPAGSATRVTESAGVGSATMLKSPVFWLMFAMMSLMSTSGLMVISQIGNFAADFGITKLTVSGAPALPLALTIDRYTNGLTRPFFGWLSDRVGRENTMFCAFTLGAVAVA